MRYEDFKKSHMEAYPSLHPDEADLLDHMFLCPGNGLEWSNGELIDCVTGGVDSPEGIVEMARLHARAFFVNQIESEKSREDDGFGIRAESIKYWERELEDLDLDVSSLQEKEWQRRRNYLSEEFTKEDANHCWFLNGDGTIGTVIKMSSYSRINSVPDDIKPDWLQAVRRLIDLTKTNRFRFETEETSDAFKKVELTLESRFPRTAP